LNDCIIDEDYSVSFEDAESSESITFVDFDGNKKNIVNLLKNQNAFQGTILYPISKMGKKSNITLFCKILSNSGQSLVLGSNIDVVKNSSKNRSVYLDPPFVQDHSNINIYADGIPDGNAIIEIANKKFKSKVSNGQLNFNIDTRTILKDSDFYGKTLRKMPLEVKIGSNNFYGELGVVPKSLRSLQATNDPQRPECVILDTRPAQDQSFKFEPISLDCFQEPIIGPLYQTNTQKLSSPLTSLDSNFKNCHQGFISDSSTLLSAIKIIGTHASSNVDKEIIDSGFDFYTVASVIISDNSVPVDVASTVPVVKLVKHHSSTNFDLTFKLRGVIEKPYFYYHSIYIPSGSTVAATDRGSVVFRFPNGTEIAKNFVFGSTDTYSVLNKIKNLIETDATLIKNEIVSEIINTGSRQELIVKSNLEFSIYKGQVSSESNSNKIQVELNTNRALRLFVTDCADRDVLQSISKVVFNTEPFKGAIADVISADSNYILIDFNPGFNKPNGFFISDTTYCVEFFGVKSIERNRVPETLTFNRMISKDGSHIPTINHVVSQNGRVFCQAEINGKYQIFIDNYPN